MLTAAVGDRLIIRGHRVGEAPREAEIVEVCGENGGPPFVVRWGADGHESRIYPGDDAFVERATTVDT